MSAGLVVCFLLWLGAGVAAMRALPSLRERIGASAPGARLAASVGLLLLSAVTLLLGIILVQSTSQSDFVRWLLVGLIGLVFVLAQCFAVAVMLSLAEPNVTSGSAAPSIKEGKDS